MFKLIWLNSVQWIIKKKVLQPGRGVHSVQFSSVAQSCPTLWPHGLQHTRPPCPSPTPRVYSNSCPLSRWCHPSISSSVIPFSSCLQSFPASGSFQMRQLFTSGSQSVGVSATTSVLPMNILRGHLPLTKCYMRPCPLHKQYWKTMNTSPVLLQVMICSIQSLTHAFISGTLTKCLAHTS